MNLDIGEKNKHDQKLQVNSLHDGKRQFGKKSSEIHSKKSFASLSNRLGSLNSSSTSHDDNDFNKINEKFNEKADKFLNTTKKLRYFENIHASSKNNSVL